MHFCGGEVSLKSPNDMDNWFSYLNFFWDIKEVLADAFNEFINNTESWWKWEYKKYSPYHLKCLFQF